MSYVNYGPCRCTGPIEERQVTVERGVKEGPNGIPFMYFWMQCKNCIKEEFRVVDGETLRVREAVVLKIWDTPPEEA